MTNPLEATGLAERLHAESDRLGESLAAVAVEQSEAQAAFNATANSIVHGERDAAREVTHRLATVAAGLTFRRSEIGSAAVVAAATPLVAAAVDAGAALFAATDSVVLGSLSFEPSLFGSTAAAALADVRTALARLDRIWREDAI